MVEREKDGKSRYQLRHAAGMYWILDMEQEGVPYKKPLAVNEIGAAIWKMMEQGIEKQEMEDWVCRKYRAEREAVSEDIEKFRKQLQEYGFSLQGGENG